MVVEGTEKTAFALPSVGKNAADPVSVSAELTEISARTDFADLIGHAEHLVFQSGHWLSAWFAAMDCHNVMGRYWLTFRDGSGEKLMSLPLVLRRKESLRVIEIPDCGVSDYLGPIFHRRRLAGMAPAPKIVWAQLKSVLPPADLLRFEGLKAEIGGHSNPLLAHRLVQVNRQYGWKVNLPESWDSYQAMLSPRMRDKLAKARRRFLRQPDTRMAVANTGAEALEWLEHLDRMQRDRLAQRGKDIRITGAEFTEFYRVLAAKGIETGEVVMAGLFSGDEPVALNYAVRAGNRATYLRLANAFGAWAPMCPGLLATEHIMRHLHSEGVRIFDFGLGDYEYKMRFGGKPFPLFDLDLPLSGRGVPHAAMAYARRTLRNVEWIRRLTGRHSLAVQPCKSSED
ncbi:MAG: GNAT family N-acetyltransferase [Rhizobiales bacterium]|nr:GNAT family N-acetyltransferase [Hyphomicrobiales bacterium]